MLLLRLWNYLRGYVIIKVEGYFLEKFINICIHRQIYLWDVRRQKSCVVTMKVSIKGFKMLRPIVKKTNCRVRLVHKRGIPFVLNRYRGRKTFVFGAALFIVLFYLLSSFIWTIEISGNKEVDSQLIIDRLASYGVEAGTLKYKVNTENIVNNMMMDVKELAWIGVVVKGTKVKVEVVEGIRPPEFVKTDEPCDIVATRDGIIKSIVAEEGLDLVKAGDTVKKGQVLITGTIPNKNEGEPPRIVHSLGSIKARTWYEKDCAVKTTLVEKQRTGNSKSRYSLVLFNKRLNLMAGKVPYENYEKIDIDKRLSIGEDLVFPFSMEIDKYYENKLVEKKLSMDEAKQLASDTAYREAIKGISESAQIVETRVNFIENGEGQLVANVVVECLEDIGKPVKIGGD